VRRLSEQEAAARPQDALDLREEGAEIGRLVHHCEGQREIDARTDLEPAGGGVLESH